MGKLLKEYFSIIYQRKINPLVFSFICITFFIHLNGCVKNNETNQKVKKEVPTSLSKSEVNFTGYIKGVIKEGSENYLIIDTVEWFSGEDAIQSFNKDKKEGKNKIDEITNGYYIRNVKIDSLKFRMSDTAKVTMQTLSYNQSGNYNFNEKIDISKFISLLNNEEYQRFKQKLYKFQILNNEIVSIKEIYLP